MHDHLNAAVLLPIEDLVRVRGLCQGQLVGDHLRSCKDECREILSLSKHNTLDGSPNRSDEELSSSAVQTLLKGRAAFCDAY